MVNDEIAFLNLITKWSNLPLLISVRLKRWLSEVKCYSSHQIPDLLHIFQFTQSILHIRDNQNKKMKHNLWPFANDLLSQLSGHKIETKIETTINKRISINLNTWFLTIIFCNTFDVFGCSLSNLYHSLTNETSLTI